MDQVEIDKKDSYLHQESYEVRAHEIVPQRRLTLPSLVKLLQECSMQHIIKLKASFWDIENLQLSWILLRKQVKLLRSISFCEKITVLTYPTGFEKFFAYRDYLVFDANKKLVATASSTWSLMNTSTRKLSRIPEAFFEFNAPSDVPRLKKPESRLVPSSELSEIEHKTIGYYDLDWNGHTNNTNLCKWMTQALIHKGIQEENIKEANFIFKNESKLNEKLTFFSDENIAYCQAKVDEKVICEMSIVSS